MVTELITSKRERLAALCRKYDVARLDIFGSATHGNFNPKRSDFDFLVEFHNLVNAPQGA